MFVIGIDLGTTSLKGIIMNEKGIIEASHSVEYGTDKPNVGHSEQNPEIWYDACIEVLKKLCIKFPKVKNNCSGISFSGQMHSLIILDKNDEVIRPAILWNDVRTDQETQLLNTNYRETLLNITKNRAVEGFTLPKVLWLKDNEPVNYEKIDTILLPKDYLRFRLTGKKHMDYSDASGTLMLDIESKTWSQELAEKFDYNISWLPPLVNSSDFVGYASEKIMQKIGFTTAIPVFAGGADNACAALASGISNENLSLLSIGTSGVYLSNEEKLRDYDGSLHFFNHVIGNYYSMGVTLAAGDALKWTRSILNPNLSYNELLKDIDNIPCGSDGLIFTPYINGERTPHFDSNIRGSFVGLDARHTQSHILRSVLEGITFSLRDAYELSKKAKGNDVKSILSVGGGAKNNKWLQIQADILNKEIYVLNVEEGPALGAAMLAALGSNWYKSVDECIKTCVEYSLAAEPIMENVEHYNNYYKIYKEVYDSQSHLCEKLTKLRKE